MSNAMTKAVRDDLARREDGRLFSGLTPEQKKQALAHRGEETHGEKDIARREKGKAA